MKRFDALILLCVIAVGYLLDHALEAHREVRERRQRQDTCTHHLKDLATALEMYSTDRTGAYPHTLADLVPNYIILPTCPAADGRAYSYERSTMPDAFTLMCPAGHLGYSSYQGLLEP